MKQKINLVWPRGGPPARLLRTPPCNVTGVMRIRATGLYGTRHGIRYSGVTGQTGVIADLFRRAKVPAEQIR